MLEVAILNVRPGQGAAFEAAFSEAQAIIAAAPGYQRHELRRCVEAEDRYLLLVWWTSLEAHTNGFRASADYRMAVSRNLLRRLYLELETPGKPVRVTRCA